MRVPRMTFAVLSALLALAGPVAFAAPAVVFNTSALDVAPNTACTTSAIVVQSPGGLTQVDLDIVVPTGLTLDTSPSGTGIACLTPGAGTSMFFASWNAGARTISISTMIDGGGQVVQSLQFTTGATVALQEITLVKPTDRGSWPAGTTFGALTLQPPHVVSISSGPSLSATTVDPGGTTTCSASATDTLGHAVNYRWTASVAGGSFANDSAASTTYTAPANNSKNNLTVTLTCTATCAVNSAAYASKTANLTVKPHFVSFSAAPAAAPAAVVGGGQTSVTATATDNLGHSVTYSWSDGSAGGTFAPSAAAQNPTYTAPGNGAAADRTITLTCTARCSTTAAVTTSANLSLLVSTDPPKTVAVTSSGGSPVSVEFGIAEVGGKKSPQSTNFSLGYRAGAKGITLNAPAACAGDHPRWFSHWKLNGKDQAAGTRNISFDIGTTDHTAEAVYDKLVGDIDGDGDVDRDDADLILRALFGDRVVTPQMDTNQDGKFGPKVNPQDARWILANPYTAAGGEE